jgi:hypothetical protein
MLDALLRETFEYFLKEIDESTGLIADKNKPGGPASTACVGLALSAYVVAAERKILSRDDAREKVLTVLRFLQSSKQAPDADATGYKGFYYHFLEIQTGRRTWECELSTIDTAIIMAGILTVASYFTKANIEERELRDLAEFLLERVDWQWATDGKATISHGWKPESGFLPFQWSQGYSEALLLYILAAGSARFPIGTAGYEEWVSTFEVKQFYGMEYIYAGPLFIHQLSHSWIDFRGIRDRLNRKLGFDYFENSRRATYVQRHYAIENPHSFRSYGEQAWGFTASDGPGPKVIEVDGVQRTFFGYVARGAPLGPDDGTISPWAAAASLPFAPEIVIDTVRRSIEHFELKGHSDYGFDASFNATFPERSQGRHGWISPWIFGLNQGPIILMIENYQSGLIWRLLRNCPYIVRGLWNLGFEGGWLETSKLPAEAS